jgi:predicted RND superfamily exporter protein
MSVTEAPKNSARTIQVLLLWLVGKGRQCTLFGVVLTTLILAYFALQVPIESSNASMVSHTGELQGKYDSFRKIFGNDEVLLLALTDPALLEAESLNTIGQVTEGLTRIKGVSRVLSLTNAEQLVAGDFGSELVPLIPEQVPGKNYQNAINKALEQNPLLAQLLISRDRKTGIIIIDLVGDVDQQGRALAAIEALLSSDYSDKDWHLTGIPLQKLTISRLIQRDQKVIIPFSVLVLGTLLLVFFRRFSGLLLPIAVMATSLCWTVGVYTLCGFSLNTITALLPPVIMVLSVSTTVHLYSGWLQLAGKSGDAKPLIVEEFRQLFLPCLFTALTTALGLVSLTVSSIPAVKLFGAFSALGVMLSFLVNILLVPTILSYMPLPKKRFRYDTGRLSAVLSTTASLTVNHPRLVFAFSLLLALAALSGLSNINNNTDLIRFVKPSEKIYQDTMFIENAVGGVNSLEFMLTRTDSSSLTRLDDLGRVDKLQGSINNLQQVAGSYSLLNVIKQLNRAETNQAQLSLPDRDQDLLYLFDLIEVAPNQNQLRKLVDPRFTTLRINVRIKAIGSADAAILISRIEQLAKRELGNNYELRPTGDFYQVVVDSNRLVSNVVRSFCLSLSMVLVAIFILFRSFKLLAIALIPNLVPLAWTGGIMGALHIDLSTGTAMIAAVVIGLTVDSTIHYLARYQREFQGDSKESVTITTNATGRALTISAIVLFLGFSMGGLSSFLPTIYFSLLTGVTMLGALVCDLLVLPASLVLFNTKEGSVSE